MSGTIFAVASGAGRAGIAVVRLSGTGAGAALQQLSRRSLPKPRVATLTKLRDDTGDPLDDALVVWFPAPRSYTGEDLAELHVHGGRAVLNGVLTALAALPGLRAAAPGEFTRRAYDNGKLDLTAAEALADLVDAETPEQRRQALRQLEGRLARVYEGWATRLTRVLAHLEAEIDFADEDLPEDLVATSRREVTSLAQEIREHLADRRGEILRDGFSIAIVGPPNVGKSSLLNALARRDVAIVTDIAGTTRDVLEVRLDLGGYPVIVADTAGLRETAEPVEAEGVRRARARAAAADLRLVLGDATHMPMTETDALAVVNKVDLVRPELPPGTFAISARTGEGIPALVAAIEARVRARLDDLGEVPALTRARHRRALEDGLAALERLLEAPQPDLAAEDARLALRALGRITGRVDVEDLLDLIFRDFCIGK